MGILYSFSSLPKALDARFGIYTKNAAQVNGRDLDWLRLKRFPGGCPRVGFQERWGMQVEGNSP